MKNNIDYADFYERVGRTNGWNFSSMNVVSRTSDGTSMRKLFAVRDRPICYLILEQAVEKLFCPLRERPCYWWESTLLKE